MGVPTWYSRSSPADYTAVLGWNCSTKYQKTAYEQSEVFMHGMASAKIVKKLLIIKFNYDAFAVLLIKSVVILHTQEVP